jgi:hypothetical protein
MKDNIKKMKVEDDLIFVVEKPEKQPQSKWKTISKTIRNGRRPEKEEDEPIKQNQSN